MEHFRKDPQELVVYKNICLASADGEICPSSLKDICGQNQQFSFIVYDMYRIEHGLPRWLSGKDSAGQCRRHKRPGFDPWVGQIPWRRAWQPTPVLLPGEFHGQRSLVGYSPLGVTKSQTRLGTHAQ